MEAKTGKALPLEERTLKNYIDVTHELAWITKTRQGLQISYTEKGMWMSGAGHCRGPAGPWNGDRQGEERHDGW